MKLWYSKEPNSKEIHTKMCHAYAHKLRYLNIVKLGEIIENVIAGILRRSISNSVFLVHMEILIPLMKIKYRYGIIMIKTL